MGRKRKPGRPRKAVAARAPKIAATRRIPIDSGTVNKTVGGSFATILNEFQALPTDIRQKVRLALDIFVKD